MSDEARDYVKQFSPYTGTTFFFHYVMGDIANASHDYEIYIGDDRLCSEWPFSRRSVVRMRGELVRDGFLEPVAGPRPGQLLTVRFVFREDVPIVRQLGARSTWAIPGSNVRQNGSRRAPKRASPPITNQRELKGTELAPTTSAKPPATADPDPVTRAAHKLTVLAFEQPVKPELARTNGNAFAAALSLIERLLRSGTSDQCIRRAIEQGVAVWTLAGLQTAVAQANPKRRRAGGDGDSRSLPELLAAATAAERRQA